MQHRHRGPLLLLIFLFSNLALPLSAQVSSSRSLIVGYFGQWGLYNAPPYTLKDLAGSNKAALLDQLNYAQTFVTGGHCSVADRNADLDHSFAAGEAVNGVADDPASPFRGHLHQLAELKQAYPRLKVFISLEGRAPDFAFDAQPENRQAFVASCIDLFLKGNLGPGISVPGLFDGIDLDWEYPRGPDAANFLALLTEFRQQMDRLRPGFKLSVAVGPSPRMYEGTDFAAVASQVDEIGLMTYDFAGPWMQTTGLIAPLYAVPAPSPLASQVPSSPTPVGANPTASTTRAAKAAVPTASLLAGKTTPQPPPGGGIAGSAQAFLAAGVPAAKLLLGVPFYGYGWTQVPDQDDGLFQEGTPVRGDRPYSSIQTLAAHSSLHRDPVSGTPWLFDGDAFWTFDDPCSIQTKGEYAARNHLGGLMIWELSGDTKDGSLLHAAHQGLIEALPTGTVAASCPR